MLYTSLHLWFFIGLKLHSQFTHWLGLHWIAICPLHWNLPLITSTHCKLTHWLLNIAWILLDWNHHHWINSRIKTSTISHWVEHSLTSIITCWLILTLNLVHKVNYNIPTN